MKRAAIASDNEKDIALGEEIEEYVETIWHLWDDDDIARRISFPAGME